MKVDISKALGIFGMHDLHDRIFRVFTFTSEVQGLVALEPLKERKPVLCYLS